MNVLGVPDTHAPTFHKVTVAADKPAGSPTAIHATVRDNSPWYVVNMNRTNLIYSVGGGAETLVCMTNQGSQQFVGQIPDLSGVISYRVESTDHAGTLLLPRFAWPPRRAPHCPTPCTRWSPSRRSSPRAAAAESRE